MWRASVKVRIPNEFSNRLWLMQWALILKVLNVENHWQKQRKWSACWRIVLLDEVTGVRGETIQVWVNSGKNLKLEQWGCSDCRQIDYSPNFGAVRSLRWKGIAWCLPWVVQELICNELLRMDIGWQFIRLVVRWVWQDVMCEHLSSVSALFAL